MDLSVQTLQGPPPLQAAQPLAFLPPGAIPAPDSGVGAFTQGLRNGGELAAPLDQGIQQAAYWNSPEGQAAIARSQLQKTQATQENEAAQKTPTLPLQQRVLQGTQINSALEQLPSQTRLGVVSNESKLATIPSLTEQTITGAKAATQAAGNQIATTPEYNSTNQMSEEEMGLNAQRQANAMDAAKKRAQVNLAGIPPGLLGSQGGAPGLGIQYYPKFENGKMSLQPETTQMIQQQDEDGSFHNVLVGKETGKVYKDFGKGIQQQRMDQSLGLAGARYGVGQNSPNATIANIAATQAQADPNLSNKAAPQAMKVQGEWNGTINKLYRPKVQLLQGFDSVAQKALDPNSTGVPDVDLIDTAGRLYKGGAMTEVQFDAIKRASGIPATIWNAPAALGQGKFLTPAQRQDLIQSVNNFAEELKQSYQNDYDNMAQQLPPGASPTRYLGSRDLLSSSASPSPGQQQNLAGKDNAIREQGSSDTTYTTPQAHQQAIEWAKANPQDPRAADVLKTAQQALGNGQ